MVQATSFSSAALIANDSPLPPAESHARAEEASGSASAPPARPLSLRQRFRIRFGPGMLLGMTLADWIGLLHDNHFGVERHYWLRAASISLNSLSNSALRQIEDAAFLPRLQDVRPEAPLFILGHARSGTTHLHNLLAMDQRFAYPNVYQVYYPHTFLSTEAIFARLLASFLPKKRPQDNVALTLNMPAEDEVATCIATCQSPYMRYVFPHRGDYYDRYYTFRTVAEHEKSRWKNALLLFLKKLTWKYERPLLLKSPPHTARIRLLLEMFPNARFVHIHRNPYRVFQSTKHLDPMAFRSFALQPPERDVDQRILQVYKHMYDVYFADRTRIPRGQFHEICFDDLEADPIGQLRETYQALGLPSFEDFRPRLEQYVSSLGDYRKNEFPDVSPRLRARIYRAWHRCFEEWGYRQ
jgi:omega-hydroxy-beta-dihydromenaquinone-9 sulfotransferase